MSWRENAEEPLKPLSHVETLQAIRDSLVRKNGRNYCLRISGCESEFYGKKNDAIDRLEEVLQLRPMTFDVKFYEEKT